MIFINRRKEKLKIQEMSAQLERQQAENKSLFDQLRVAAGKIQEFDTLEDTTHRYRGNNYNTYSASITEIDKKYSGTAEWGVSTAGNLINVMAAFILGQGVGFTGRDAVNELAFINEMMNYNDFNDEGLAKTIVEQCIEGKMLLELSYDKTHQWDYLDGEREVQRVGMVKIRIRPWRRYNYTITTAENDYLDYTKAAWEGNGNEIKAGILDASKFVYRKFGGPIYDPNTACPKIMLCLTEIDNYDKCKRDWREINHLFASPTPAFGLEDMKQVKEFLTMLDKINWRIGKAIAHIGTFAMVSASLEGAQSIERERLALQKTISGATGVPVHFYDPEVMSNKRLGENEMEFVWASFNLERKILISAIDEIVMKAIQMQIENTHEALDYRKVKSTIKVFTDGDWQRIRDIWMPLRKEKEISQDTLLSRIPGIDVEEEKKLLDAENEVENKRVDNEATKQLNDLKSGAYKVPFNNPINFNPEEPND